MIDTIDKASAVARRATDLEAVFNQCFMACENTRLVGGGEEPIYQPFQRGTLAKIVYTRDFFSSALHEVAHWCVAGKARRQLEDFGYWYNPDGRTPEQQVLFEQVEVKPQAMEWLFSNACGIRFRVSADNLSQGLGPSDNFKKAIVKQAGQYATEGLPKRAQTFAEALANYYGGDFQRAELYQLSVLD